MYINSLGGSVICGLQVSLYLDVMRYIDSDIRNYKSWYVASMGSYLTFFRNKGKPEMHLISQSNDTPSFIRASGHVA
jgi:ATP-dependent protease ClpP protease subunit